MIMHKDHIAAVLLAAVEGQKVLVVVTPTDSIRDWMDAACEVAGGWQTGLANRVNRTNGGERIDLVTGGTIRIVGWSAVGSRGLRGNKYDQAFVPIGTTKNTLKELEPALMTSKVGLITGY